MVCGCTNFFSWVSRDCLKADQSHFKDLEPNINHIVGVESISDIWQNAVSSVPLFHIPSWRIIFSTSNWRSSLGIKLFPPCLAFIFITSSIFTRPYDHTYMRDVNDRLDIMSTARNWENDLPFYFCVGWAVTTTLNETLAISYTIFSLKLEILLFLSG